MYISMQGVKYFTRRFIILRNAGDVEPEIFFVSILYISSSACQKFNIENKCFLYTFIVGTLVLIGRFRGRTASATTRAVAYAHCSSVHAFVRAWWSVCARAMMRVFFALKHSTRQWLSSCSCAGTAASVGDVNDYVDKIFTVFIRAAYQLSIQRSIYTTERAHTADEFCWSQQSMRSRHLK